MSTKVIALKVIALIKWPIMIIASSIFGVLFGALITFAINIVSAPEEPNFFKCDSPLPVGMFGFLLISSFLTIVIARLIVTTNKDIFNKENILAQ